MVAVVVDVDGAIALVVVVAVVVAVVAGVDVLVVDDIVEVVAVELVDDVVVGPQAVRVIAAANTANAGAERMLSSSRELQSRPRPICRAPRRNLTSLKGAG